MHFTDHLLIMNCCAGMRRQFLVVFSPIQFKTSLLRLACYLQSLKLIKRLTTAVNISEQARLVDWKPTRLLLKQSLSGWLIPAEMQEARIKVPKIVTFMAVF